MNLSAFIIHHSEFAARANSPLIIQNSSLAAGGKEGLGYGK